MSMRTTALRLSGGAEDSADARLAQAREDESGDEAGHWRAFFLPLTALSSSSFFMVDRPGTPRLRASAYSWA
jgi:hypothetical protein